MHTPRGFSVCGKEFRQRAAARDILTGMKNILIAGAVLAGLAIAATQYFGLAGELHYLWAALAIVWGFLIWRQK